MATNAELIAQVYVGFYDRAPDPVGLQYWVGRLEAGVSIQDIGDSFAASPEASDTYPFFKFPDLLSQNDFLAQVYQNVFGREIDQDGLDYYSARMTAGESAGSVVASILGNASTNEGSPDQAYLQNKVDAGLHWALEAAASDVDIYQENGRLTDQASDSSHGILDGITADAATVEAANTETDAYFGGGGVGETFTLTDSAVTGTPDDITGTDNADTIQGTNDSLDQFDSIDGAAGTDTLNLFDNGPGFIFQGLPTGAVLANVEVVNLFQGGTTGTVNAASFGGDVEQLWQIGASNNVTNVAAGQTIGFRNAAVNNIVAVGDGVASASIALDGVTSGAVVSVGETTAGDLTSVSVAGDVAVAGAVTVDTAANTTSVDTINLGLTSDGIVTIAADVAVLTTLDASASTGDLTIDASLITALETLTGGSGSDTLTVNVAALTNETFALDAGAGVDTITVDIDYGVGATAVSLTGGEGGDTFNLDATTGNLAAVADNEDMLENLVSITDFDAANDVLDITGLAAITGPGTAQNVVNNALIAADAQDLFEAVTAVSGATADNGYSVFEFEGSTYVYGESGAADGLDAGDSLIQITGIAVADLTADNFIA